MKRLLVLFALFGVGGSGAPEIKEFVEQHCVAVLTEAHTETHSFIGFDDRMPETDDKGNYVIHVPEKTLKLRCKL